MEKIRKKIEKVAEETVNRKVEQKTEEKTDQAMDSLFNTDKKVKRKIKKSKKNSSKNSDNSLDKADENSIFNFEWKYTLKMESEKTKKEDMDMLFSYYIDPNSTAYSSRFEIEDMPKESGNMLMVIDPSTGLNIMLTEIGEFKVKKKMPSYNDEDQESQEIEYTVVKTDTKTILN